jgi:hypothetical protein
MPLAAECVAQGLSEQAGLGDGGEAPAHGVLGPMGQRVLALRERARVHVEIVAQPRQARQLIP